MELPPPKAKLNLRHCFGDTPKLFIDFCCTHRELSFHMYNAYTVRKRVHTRASPFPALPQPPDSPLEPFNRCFCGELDHVQMINRKSAKLQFTGINKVRSKNLYNLLILNLAAMLALSLHPSYLSLIHS